MADSVEAFVNGKVNGVANGQVDRPSGVRPSLGYLGGNFSQKDSSLALQGPWAATGSNNYAAAGADGDWREGKKSKRGDDGAA
jgi:hypothetical protein